MRGPAGVGAGRRCVVGATARGGAPRAEKAATACGGWRARRRPGSGACGFFFLFYPFFNHYSRRPNFFPFKSTPFESCQSDATYKGVMTVHLARLKGLMRA
jgi:hypothetical protein